MVSDSKLPIVVFATLIAIIAAPFLVDRLRELRRPILLEARVVTASTSDPAFRNGRRRVPAGEAVEVALALRIGRRGNVGEWLAPVDQLVIDGLDVEHAPTGRWPEKGRTIRTFWFTVESTNLGGDLNPENAGERIRYRTFLAPEMGRELRATSLPEVHNDDHIGRQSVTIPDGAGTFRLYARVELVESDTDLRPIQVATTLGVESVLEAQFPTISRSAELGPRIDNSVAELFNLPGFEPRSESGTWNDVTKPAFSRTFSDLVEERLVVSSRTLAAVAITGGPNVDEESFVPLGELEITSERIHRRGQTLRWGDGVESGDVLAENEHWMVLLGDDGNGDLDPADPVLHCWGRPPERTTLWASLETETATLKHFRHAN